MIAPETRASHQGRDEPIYLAGCERLYVSMLMAGVPDVTFRSVASFSIRPADVGLSPDSGGVADIPQPPLGAKRRNSHECGT